MDAEPVTLDTPAPVTPLVSASHWTERARAYFDEVHLLNDGQATSVWDALSAELTGGIQSATLVMWLAERRIVFAGCEAEVAQRLLEFVPLRPPKPFVSAYRPREALTAPKQLALF